MQILIKSLEKFLENRNSHKCKYTKNEMSELKITTNELHLLCNITNENEFKKEAKEFLANRWQRIKNTNLAYPHAGGHPVSEACYRISCYLEKIHNEKNRYHFLMPTIEVTESLISLENISKFKPYEFVMTDDNKSMIILSECLEYANKFPPHNDGTIQLQPTRLLNNQSSHTLSDRERARVINANKFTFEYSQMLMKESFILSYQR